MIFRVFFIILCSLFFYKLIESKNYLFVWPVINFSLLSFAYCFNKPSLILAKSDQHFSLLLLVLNLPWLMLTWGIFRIQILLSKEDFCNRIGSSNIWISSKPISQKQVLDFDLIIDLTAEFLPFSSSVETICIPNLDGMPLSNCQIPNATSKETKILVHCANGHGRSALFTTKLLMSFSYTSNYSESLKLIKNSRPLAKPNKSQIHSILN